MKLVFCWDDMHGVLRPGCHVDGVGGPGSNLLTMQLIDDGGLGQDLMLEAVREGLEIADAIAEGRQSQGEWIRETFGAELTAAEARIYWLEDESRFELFPLRTFRAALAAWEEFMKLAAEVSLTRTVEV